MFEDNHVLAVFKPVGWLSQPDGTLRPSLADWAKNYLKEKYSKPGNVYLGIVHRLDVPVSGIVLFAKTSKAASRLCAQFRERSVRKAYRARVSPDFRSPKSGLLVHYLDEEALPRVRVAQEPAPGLKKASLEYRVVAKSKKAVDLEIELHTGRRHQIRAQLAALGCPILGDKLYGSSKVLEGGAIALTADRLEFKHPVGAKPIVIRLSPSMRDAHVL